MAKKASFHALTLKLLGMLMASAVVAVALYFLCSFIGGQVIDRIYLSPTRVETRITANISSFRSFVEENNVSSTDALSVGQWNRAHADVRLTINGRNTILNSDSYGAEITLSDTGLSVRLGQGTGYEFPVNFADGTYTVSVYDYSENRLYNIVNISSIVVSALAFVLLMLLYERHVTLSILRLSRQVRQVSRGCLQLHIQAPTRDEIGQLAEDVDAMRLSIIDKLRREEDAWQANSALITAISHDVRTPLTALLGYLDILADPDLPPEVQRAYLDICRNNAVRLKDLTDELFGFFLVFGKRTPAQTLERFDAATLLEQILLEAREELAQQGFDIHLKLPGELRGTLEVDLGHLRRVFDNLFSNLRKYADPAKPVTITVDAEDHILRICIINAIPGAASRVESTKIGLKTCEKLLTAMKDSFRQSRTADTFTAEVSLLLCEAQ